VGSVNTVYLSTDYGLSFASINVTVPSASENATISSANDDAALYSVNLEVTDDYNYGNSSANRIHLYGGTKFLF
jgi:hypothetical protein